MYQGLCDQKLSAILIPLDSVLWDKLTFAIVASFLDGIAWKYASFRLNIEAHENNAHVVAVTIHELFKVFVAKHG